MQRLDKLDCWVPIDFDGDWWNPIIFDCPVPVEFALLACMGCKLGQKQVHGDDNEGRRQADRCARRCLRVFYDEEHFTKGARAILQQKGDLERGGRDANTPRSEIPIAKINRRCYENHRDERRAYQREYLRRRKIGHKKSP